MAAKTLLMILGMHRSGTSAVTRCCNLLGMHLGAQFIETNEHNARGFWEHSEVVSISESMLAALHSSWDDIRAMPEDMQVNGDDVKRLQAVFDQELEAHDLWAVKDPRLCRLLPVWNELIKTQKLDSKALIVFRNPLESALSLEKRDGMDRNKAMLLWLRYNLDAELESRECPRAFLYYPDFLEDWESQMQRVYKTFDLPWPNLSAKERKAVDSFLNKDLKNQAVRDEDILQDGTILPWVKDCFSALHKAVNTPKGQKKAFDDIRKALDFYSAGFDAAITDIAEQQSPVFDSYQQFQREHTDLQKALKEASMLLEEQKTAYEGQLAHYQSACDEKAEEIQEVLQKYAQLEKAHLALGDKYAEVTCRLAEITNSLSWRLTKPLRKLRPGDH